MRFNCRALCPSVTMLDQRRSPRFDALRGATVETPTGALTCVIRNVSQTGACLESAAPKSIPDQFFLTIWPSLNCRCEVVWRSEHKVGFRFRQEKSAEMIAALAMTPTVPSSGNPDDRAEPKDANRNASVATAREGRSARVVLTTTKPVARPPLHKSPDANAKPQPSSGLLSRPSKVGALSRPSALSFTRRET